VTMSGDRMTFVAQHPASLVEIALPGQAPNAGGDVPSDVWTGLARRPLNPGGAERVGSRTDAVSRHRVHRRPEAVLISHDLRRAQCSHGDDIGDPPVPLRPRVIRGLGRATTRAGRRAWPRRVRRLSTGPWR
jgi:hypothetical protein